MWELSVGDGLQVDKPLGARERNQQGAVTGVYRSGVSVPQQSCDGDFFSLIRLARTSELACSALLRGLFQQKSDAMQHLSGLSHLCDNAFDMLWLSNISY